MQGLINVYSVIWVIPNAPMRGSEVLCQQTVTAPMRANTAHGQGLTAVVAKTKSIKGQPDSCGHAWTRRSCTCMHVSHHNLFAASTLCLHSSPIPSIPPPLFDYVIFVPYSKKLSHSFSCFVNKFLLGNIWLKPSFHRNSACMHFRQNSFSAKGIFYLGLKPITKHELCD